MYVTKPTGFSNRKYTVYFPGNIPSNRWDTAPSSKCICLVPVRCFPRLSRSIHFGDVSEVNGQEKPSKNRMRMRALLFWKQDVVNSRKLWPLKKPCKLLWKFGRLTFANRLWKVIRMLFIVLWRLSSAPWISSFQLNYQSFKFLTQLRQFSK